MLTHEQMKKVVERSKYCQGKAYDRQQAEHLAKMLAHSFTCIRCDKPIEIFEPPFMSEDGRLVMGCASDAVILMDSGGYGSCAHDTDLITITICDDCCTKHAIHSSWLDKLSEETEKIRGKPLPKETSSETVQD